MVDTLPCKGSGETAVSSTLTVSPMAISLTICSETPTSTFTEETSRMVYAGWLWLAKLPISTLRAEMTPLIGAVTEQSAMFFSRFSFWIWMEVRFASAVS